MDTKAPEGNSSQAPEVGAAKVHRTRKPSPLKKIARGVGVSLLGVVGAAAGSAVLSGCGPREKPDRPGSVEQKNIDTNIVHWVDGRWGDVRRVEAPKEREEVLKIKITNASQTEPMRLRDISFDVDWDRGELPIYDINSSDALERAIQFSLFEGDKPASPIELQMPLYHETYTFTAGPEGVTSPAKPNTERSPVSFPVDISLDPEESRTFTLGVNAKFIDEAILKGYYSGVRPAAKGLSIFAAPRIITTNSGTSFNLSEGANRRGIEIEISDPKGKNVPAGNNNSEKGDNQSSENPDDLQKYPTIYATDVAYNVEPIEPEEHQHLITFNIQNSGDKPMDLGVIRFEYSGTEDARLNFTLISEGANLGTVEVDAPPTNVSKKSEFQLRNPITIVPGESTEFSIETNSKITSDSFQGAHRTGLRVFSRIDSIDFKVKGSGGTAKSADRSGGQAYFKTTWRPKKNEP